MSQKERSEKSTTLKDLQRAYNDLVTQKPFLTNATQGAVITALGVITSQILQGWGKVEFKEIFVMSMLNFFYITPVCMKFFSFLDTVRGGILVKLMVDQFAFAPIFNFTIMSLRLLLRGEDEYSSIPFTVAQQLPAAMLYAWVYWIPLRALAMAYVPPSLMLLVNCACAFVWSIIFAMVLG